VSDAKRILAVDDDRIFLKIVEHDLTKNGFSVMTAQSGEEGIMLAKIESPDLILLDIHMPNIEGGEVVEMLQESLQTQDIPVIFVTALLSKDEEIKRKNIIGGHYFLSKPYKIEELLEKIDKYLG
jgi:CheY-like chemotaxis protein